jgi:hypothetical protein
MISHLKSEEDYRRTIYLNFVIKSERNHALFFEYTYRRRFYLIL